MTTLRSSLSCFLRTSPFCTARSVPPPSDAVPAEIRRVQRSWRNHDLCDQPRRASIGVAVESDLDTIVDDGFTRVAKADLIHGEDTMMLCKRSDDGTLIGGVTAAVAVNQRF